jgi:hypothetical protein
MQFNSLPLLKKEKAALLAVQISYENIQEILVLTQTATSSYFSKREDEGTINTSTSVVAMLNYCGFKPVTLHSCQNRPLGGR